MGTRLALALLLAALAGAESAKVVCEDFRPCLLPGEAYPEVSDAALRNLSEALLRHDRNNAARHIRINYQARAHPAGLTDEAPDALLTVGENAFKPSTVARVRRMFDNYIADSSINEDYTDQDIREEKILMRAILDTKIMQLTHDFLATNGLINRNIKEFMGLMIQIWFDIFPRAQDEFGSCGFENIFLGELTKEGVAGMQNWIFFSSQEARKKVDYMGYVKKLDLGKKGAILEVRYRWQGAGRARGALFVGTSPELQMALYTVCFLARPDAPCAVSLGGARLRIHTRALQYMGVAHLAGAALEI